jgi:uncharacterized protein (TIGR03435 family)
MKALAIAVVRAWTALYTWRMPPALREERRAEIDSDLWEFQQDANGDRGLGPALQVLFRLLAGIPDDLGWRLEHSASGDKASRNTIALAATAAGGVIFLSVLSVIASDATRKEPASTFLISTPDIVEAELAKIRKSDAPDSWRNLQAGILAVAVPVTGRVSSDIPLQTETSAAGAPRPAFDTASIKANKSGDPRVMMVPQPGGLFTAYNVTLGVLIRNAFQLPDYQISGGPKWIGADRFDVIAKAEGNPPQEQIRLMLRTLLTERFKLNVHNEIRELPVYELVMARKDRRNGPNLRRTEADCASAATPPPPPYTNGPPSCGFIGPAPGVSLTSGRATFAFRGLTMDGLARFLGPAVRRKVIDRTGLSGYFDGEFDFTAELGPPPPPPGIPDPFDRQSFPSMFTVLQERLGLKLESRKSQLPVLVIDGAERLREN